MPRSRTTKTIAKRIDTGYFTRSHPLRAWRRMLTWGAGLVALIGVAAASVRFTKDGPKLSDAIHNPGPVSSAHARFENDCAHCHTPKSDGKGFFVSVTDESCLKCHDGAIHHVNAVQAADMKSVSYKGKMLALKDAQHPDDPTKGRAAGCATCHVEHRGKTQLAATSDAHCVVCHADLSSAIVDDSKRIAANRVIAFGATAHPSFGHKLVGPDKIWRDPTVLAFNHKKHMEQEGIKDVANNCTICHRPDPSDRRLIQPITYARDCQRCHKLELAKDEVEVAHQDLPIVRGQLADLTGLYGRWFHSLPKETQDAMLKPAAPSGGGGRTRGRGSAQPAAEAKTEEQAIGEKVGKLLSDAGAPTTAPSDATSITAIEKFVAKDMTQSCSKCHTVMDAASPGELTTTPTGFRSRWFTAARFDHDAHRDLGCKTCHLDVEKSEKTSDLLLPDLNTAAAGAQTCVQCHLSESTGQRGAPAACATCHTFHDRHFERALLTAATTQPVSK